MLPRVPDQVPATVKKQFRPTAVVSKSPGATNPVEGKRLAFSLGNINEVYKFSSDLVNQLDFHWPIKSNPNSLLGRGPLMSHCPPFIPLKDHSSTVCRFADKSSFRARPRLTVIDYRLTRGQWPVRPGQWRNTCMDLNPTALIWHRPSIRHKSPFTFNWHISTALMQGKLEKD